MKPHMNPSLNVPLFVLPFVPLFRRTRQALGALLCSGLTAGLLAAPLLMAAAPARAHGVSVGDLKIEHPYATPTPPGAKVGAGYFRAIRNTGKTADRLVSASSPAAARVELHRMTMNDGVMRMREVPAIEIPAGAEVQLRRGQEYHLMLLELKQPLKVGDRFDAELVFERAGKVTATFVVQQPKSDDGAEHAHKK